MEFVNERPLYPGILNVYYCGEEKCLPSHSFGPAVRPHYLMHFVVKGKGKYQVRDKFYELEKGDAFLITPGEITYYEADAAEPWEYTWVAFDGYGVKEILTKCGFTEENFVYSGKDRDRHEVCESEQDKEYRYRGSQKESLEGKQEESLKIESQESKRNQVVGIDMGKMLEYLKHIVDIFRSGEQNNLEAGGYLYLIFSRMIAEDDKSEEKNMKKIYFHEACSYIANNYVYDIKIGNIAQYIGIDRTYLYKVFQENAGMSPQQYLIQHRMKVAVHMLEHTELNITEISYSAGFKDTPSFCKHFKNKMGVTPLKFKSGRKLNK